MLSKLEPVGVEQVPRLGTFWLLKEGEPPWPFLPPMATEFGLQVYAIDSGTFVVDDRGVDYEALDRVDSALKVIEKKLGLRAGAGANQSLTGDGVKALGGASIAGLSYPSSNVWFELVSFTNQTGKFVIHSPTNCAFDLFYTTNLSLNASILNLNNWKWLCRIPPGQTNYTLTNLNYRQCYFVIGGPKDSDGDGLSDACELFLTHTDPNHTDPFDKVSVSITVLDSVIVEQDSSDSARFRISRQGTNINQELTVLLGLSGSATPGVDYSLSQATVSGTNAWVTFSAGQTSIELTLKAVVDTVPEGTETVTLTVLPGPLWNVDPDRASATAWILEQYSKKFTGVDLMNGLMMGLEIVDGKLQFKSNLPPQFSYINVACSGRGTVARINTTNGQVIGEYLTTPYGLTYTTQVDLGNGPQPSRTTVDMYGNVWVANRLDNRDINGTSYGSITRIGLIIGTRYSKSNDVYYVDPNGQYVCISNAVYNTCIDRDGDGFIRTSRGLADILPWSNGGDVDSDGGVSTAEDEAITEYVRVPSTGTRTIAVDKWNDIWVGGHSGDHIHLKVNGLTAMVVPGSVFAPVGKDGIAYGGYGGVIDCLGNLWSSENNGGTLLRLKPPNNFPVTMNDWEFLSASNVSMYGIAVDPVHHYIWQSSSYDYVFRWNTNGTPVKDSNGQVITYYHGSDSLSQGLVVDTNGHVWVAHGRINSTTIGHLDTNGIWLGNVQLNLNGLFVEYFANDNLQGFPVLTNW